MNQVGPLTLVVTLYVVCTIDRFVTMTAGAVPHTDKRFVVMEAIILTKVLNCVMANWSRRLIRYEIYKTIII